MLNAILQEMRWPLTAALVVSAIIMGVVYPRIWNTAPTRTADSGEYQVVAQDIADHGIITKLHYRTPGYPLLLCLTGSISERGRSLFFTRLLLHLGVIAIVVRILHGLGFQVWVCLFAALVLLTPPFVEAAGFFETETMAAFILMSSYWLLTRNVWTFQSAVAAGIAVGLSALTRPTNQLLGLALFLTLLTFRQTRRAIGVLVGSSVIIGGFAIFNLIAFGYFGLTPALGWNLSTRTASYVERVPEESVRSLLCEYRDKALTLSNSHTASAYIWTVDRARLSEVTGCDELELDRYLVRMNLDLIARSPLRYLREVTCAYAGYWLPSVGSEASCNSRLAQWGWSVLQLILVVLFLLQLVVVTGSALAHGSQILAGRMRLEYLLGLTYVFYTAIVSCAIEVGNPRYRISVEAILLLTTMMGVRYWLGIRSTVRHM